MRTRSLQSSRTDKARAEGEVRRRPTRGDANVEIGGELAKTGQSPLTEIEWFSADFDHPKLQISYGNMKFDQNRSCRGQNDLQLCFWAQVDLKIGLETKTRSNRAKSTFTAQTRLMLMTVINPD